MTQDQFFDLPSSTTSKRRRQNLGTPTAPRCARCGRPIRKGNQHTIDGKVYGSECVGKILDRKNR